GLPIKNTDIYILDENHHIVSDGTVGEIAISGQGLSLGYVNLETETKEKFIFLPEANKKVYLTGDLGSISKDHFLHYVGRVDNQIKLRGYRIELEEIETVLNGFDTIEQAVVTVEEGKQANRLIAFYVAQKDVDRQQLTDWLKSRLPDYMLPACYIRITQFPLTLNGKIDRKQLRVNDLLPQTNEPDLLVEENSEVASKVISLISEMTNVKNNSITCKTTLTELGIDSITFIKLIVNLEEMFGFEFNDQMLLFTAFPNIQTMIDYVEENIAL
ncbi:MAG: non-ribosomal peptide synthetase, partial [Clostridia bacterium]|nr:non-ribosomal peptide synthetase [Clostridia bacterium]